MTDALCADLNELKRDEFPAVEFDYQLRGNNTSIHFYHFKVLKPVRNLGIAATTLADIEAIANKHGVTQITIRMGLTNDKDEKPEVETGDENRTDSDAGDPTVQFLQSQGFRTQPPTEGGVNARKSI